MSGREALDARPAVPWPVPVLIATIAITAVLHPAWMLLHIGGDGVTQLVDDLLPVVTAVLAAALTARRASLPADRLTRLGWALLAASCAGLAGGQAIYAVDELLLGMPAPFPSAADVWYVAGTSLGIPAVLLLGGRTLPSSRLRLVMDGGIVALSVLLVSWLLALQTVWEAGATEGFSFVLGFFYPIGDVLTVVIVLSTIAHARRLNPALLVVGVGMLCFAFSDSAYAYLAATGRYTGSSPIDAGSVLGYLLLGLASYVGRDERRSREATLATWQLALPYVPLLIAGTLILGWFAGRRPMDLFSLLLMAGLIVTALARQLTANVESQSLTVRLKSTAAERAIVIEHAPVGICRLDPAQRLLAANRTFLAMLGVPWDELEGRSLLDRIVPEDRHGVAAGYAALLEGGQERLEVESRLVRGDGTTVWASQVATAVRDPDGRVQSVIAIVENVTERRRQAELAAHVQRQLLPEAALRIPGYELAGVCLPASDVAGDFYDWVVTDGGCVDLTVADVMGKGVGAGLVMATLRAVLRAAPAGLPPAERVRIAEQSMVGIDVGLFVTMFHARLEPATGKLRYVDAGHGYCCIRRPDGELVPLDVRCLPLGVRDDEGFREGHARMGPDDTLLVYSDGLVERESGSLQLHDLLAGAPAGETASRIVQRLMAGVHGRLEDDLTVLALRRQPVRAAVGGAAAPVSRSTA